MVGLLAALTAPVVTVGENPPNRNEGQSEAKGPEVSDKALEVWAKAYVAVQEIRKRYPHADGEAEGKPARMMRAAVMRNGLSVAQYNAVAEPLIARPRCAEPGA